MEFLAANKNLNSSRYFRLMGLAGIEMLCTIPFGAFVIYINASVSEVYPWVSWANTHYDFSRVDLYASIEWRTNNISVLSIELSRWFLVICAFIFFSFFGFADEARKNYRLAYSSVAKRVGLSTGNMSSGGSWTVNGYVIKLRHSCSLSNKKMFITDQGPTWHATVAVVLCPCSLRNAPSRSAILSLRSPLISPLESSTSHLTIRRNHTRQQKLPLARCRRNHCPHLLMDRLFLSQTHLLLRVLTPRST